MTGQSQKIVYNRGFGFVIEIIESDLKEKVS